MNTKFKVQIIQWHGTMVIREHEKAKKKRRKENAARNITK